MVVRYVLLGDIIRSREVPDRTSFQDRLRTACRGVNDQFESSLDTSFSLIRGIDEFGGLLATINDLYGILTLLSDSLRPRQVRIAVVRGKIDVGADRETVAAKDGPAFHRASELLEEMNPRERTFVLVGRDRFIDHLIADEINLLLQHRSTLTDRQLEVWQAYERYGTQQRAAEELGVTQQAVSSTLASASGPMIAGIEKRLESALSEYDMRFSQ